MTDKNNTQPPSDYQDMSKILSDQQKMANSTSMQYISQNQKITLGTRDQSSKGPERMNHLLSKVQSGTSGERGQIVAPQIDLLKDGEVLSMQQMDGKNQSAQSQNSIGTRENVKSDKHMHLEGENNKDYSMAKEQSLPTFAKNLNAVSNASINNTSNTRQNQEIHPVIAKDSSGAVQMMGESSDILHVESTEINIGTNVLEAGNDSHNAGSKQTLEGIVNVGDKLDGNSRSNLRSSQHTDSKNEMMLRDSYKKSEGEVNHKLVASSQLSKYIKDQKMMNLSEPLRLSDTYQEGRRETDTENPNSERFGKSGLPISKQTHTGVSSTMLSQNRINENQEMENTFYPKNHAKSNTENTLSTIDDANATRILDDLVMLNKLGMEYLSQGKFQDAQENLKNARKLITKVKASKDLHSQDYAKLYSLTMNNIGCYYKKIFKPNVALRYMKQALENELTSNQPKSHISSTKLNICAILSQLGKHQNAIEYALSAIQDLMITIDCVKIKNIRNEREKEEEIKQKNLNGSDLDIPETNVDALNQTLSIAHYNLGVQYEFTHDFPSAKEAYEEARNLAHISINTEHLLTQIDNSMNELNDKMQNKYVLGDQRSKMRNDKRTKNFYHDQQHINNIVNTKKERTMQENCQKKEQQISFIKKHQKYYKNQLDAQRLYKRANPSQPRSVQGHSRERTQYLDRRQQQIHSDMEKMENLVLIQDVRELRNHYYENAASQLPHPPGSHTPAISPGVVSADKFGKPPRKSQSNVRTRPNRLQQAVNSRSRYAIDQMSKVDNFRENLYARCESQEFVTKKSNSPPPLDFQMQKARLEASSPENMRYNELQDDSRNNIIMQNESQCDQMAKLKGDYDMQQEDSGVNTFGNNNNEKINRRSAENTGIGTEENTVSKLHEAENSTERSDQEQLQQDVALNCDERKNAESNEGFRTGESNNQNSKIMALSNNQTEENKDIDIDRYEALQYFSQLNRAGGCDYIVNGKPSQLPSSLVQSGKIPMPVGSKLNNQKARIKKLSSAMVGANKYQRNNASAKYQYLTNAYLTNNNFSPSRQKQMMTQVGVLGGKPGDGDHVSSLKEAKSRNQSVPKRYMNSNEQLDQISEIQKQQSNENLVNNGNAQRVAGFRTDSMAPCIPEENKDLFFFTTGDDRFGQQVSRKLYEKKYDKGLSCVYAAKKNKFEEHLLRSKSGGGYTYHDASKYPKTIGGSPKRSIKNNSLDRRESSLTPKKDKRQNDGAQNRPGTFQGDLTSNQMMQNPQTVTDFDSDAHPMIQVENQHKQVKSQANIFSKVNQKPILDQHKHTQAYSTAKLNELTKKYTGSYFSPSRRQRVQTRLNSQRTGLQSRTKQSTGRNRIFDIASNTQFLPQNIVIGNINGNVCINFNNEESMLNNSSQQLSIPMYPNGQYLSTSYLQQHQSRDVTKLYIPQDSELSLQQNPNKDARDIHRYINRSRTKHDNLMDMTQLNELCQGPNRPILTGGAMNGLGGVGFPGFMEELLTSQQDPRKRNYKQRNHSKLRTAQGLISNTNNAVIRERDYKYSRNQAMYSGETTLNNDQKQREKIYIEDHDINDYQGRQTEQPSSVEDYTPVNISMAKRPSVNQNKRSKLD